MPFQQTIQLLTLAPTLEADLARYTAAGWKAVSVSIDHDVVAVLFHHEDESPRVVTLAGDSSYSQ